MYVLQTDKGAASGACGLCGATNCWLAAAAAGRCAFILCMQSVIWICC